MYWCEKFKLYIFCKVETDGKTLLGMIEKFFIQSFNLCSKNANAIAVYSLNLVHTPGKQMYMADVLSHDFLNAGCNNHTELDYNIHIHITMLTNHLPITIKQWKFLDV